MAERGVVTLTEDDLSCDVCFEVYRDPQALRCLHTFCKECADKLVDQYNEVECPHCREVTNVEDVRKDFKTQALVDQHNKEMSTKHPAPGGLTCSMCQKKNQVPQLYCTECDKYMCTSCHMIHQGIKACTDHEVRQIEVVQKSYQEQLEKTIRMLKREEAEFKMTIKHIIDNIGEINHDQNEQIKTVDKDIDKQIEELNNRRLTLYKQIQEVDMSKLEKLEQDKLAYVKSQEHVGNNITMISDVIKVGDVKTMKHTSSYIADAVSTELNKIKQQLPSKITLLSEAPSISFKKDANINRSQETSQGTPKASSPNHVLNYANLIDNTYEISRTGLTKCKINKITLIDDALYCACGNTGIKVYNKDCELISTIITVELGNVSSVVQYKNGDLIVSCSQMQRNGIHQLKPNGEYKGLIAKGVFHQVCIFKDVLYGLKWENSWQLVSFEAKGKIWVQIRDPLLIQRQGSEWDGFCVNERGIYFFVKKTIHVYDHQGNEKYKADYFTDTISWFRFSDADDEGNAFLADWTNGKIKVIQKGVVHNIGLKGTSARLFSLVTDQTGETIWAASEPMLHPAKLIKYTKI